MKTYKDVLAGFVLIWQGLYIHNVWHLLPTTLPSHFALNGAPNRYAPRSILWFVLAISVFLFLSTLIAERLPHAFNLPKPVGDPDRPRLEALASELIGWLRLEITCTFAYTLWSMVNLGLHKSEGLGTGFTFVCLGVVSLTVVYFLWRMKTPPARFSSPPA
jgi:hypothetical protein